MKILLITDMLYPNLNANSSIAYTLGKYLKERFDCNVSVFGYEKEWELLESNDTDENGFTVYKANECNYLIKIIKDSSKWKKIICSCFDKMVRRFYFDKMFRKSDVMTYSYATQLKTVLKKNTFDCIIVFSEPRYSLKALNRIKTNIPIISYKLDPWSTNKMVAQKRESKQEEKSDKRVSAIIVTDLIYNDYQQQIISSNCIQKLYVLDFPGITRSKQADLCYTDCFDTNKINCVYVGSLYEKIRNPEYCINSFKALQKSNIVLHIYGRQNGKCIDIKSLPNNIIYHGEVSKNEADYYMDKADILISIGNTVSNQMPSKILTYFSTGKPIVNFYKLSDCPSLKYMERYPLALNIWETETVESTTVKLIKDFCTQNTGQKIPFDVIQKEYYSCTPEYVGTQLFKIINRVVDDWGNRK